MLWASYRDIVVGSHSKSTWFIRGRVRDEDCTGHVVGIGVAVLECPIHEHQVWVG